MVNLKKAFELRGSMAASLEAMSAAERNAWLYERVIKEVTAPSDRLVRALAQVFWIRYRFEYDFADGRSILKKALTVFSEMADDNRRLGVLFRDAKVTMGNLCARFDRHSEAVEWYQDAIAGEHDYDRKALGLLNISRSHVQRGDLYHALLVAQRITRAKLVDKRLYAYFSLLKAKVLLLLGYETACLSTLTEGRCTDAPDTKAKREALYLESAAKLDLKDAKAFLATQAKFLSDLRRLGLEQDADFYELEGLVLASFPWCSRQTARPARIKALAKTAEHKVYARLSERIRNYTRTVKNLPQEFAALRRDIEKLDEIGDQRLYQVVSVLFAEHLADKQQYRRAATVLNAMAVRWAKFTAGFPRRVAEQLEAQPSLIRKYAADVGMSLPIKDRQDYANVGFMLLGE